jgi:hypothetical protein
MTKAHVAHVYYIDPNGRPRVGWDNWKDMQLGDKLYASPQSAWVGLTDDEIDDLISYPWGETKDWVKAIEAKLKAKNL